MPLFPNNQISLYYIVTIDVAALLNNLGIDGITQNFGQINRPLKFFATKFEVQQSAEIQPQTYIQGKPGYIAHSAPTPVYTYTIECPLTTYYVDATDSFGNPVQQTPSDFSPFNSLSFLAINWLNWQWQLLHKSVSVTNPSGFFRAILESFDVDFSPEQGTQNIKIVSNTLLVDYIKAEFVGDLPDVVNYPQSRLLKNYDVAVGMQVSLDGKNTFSVLNGSNTLENINFNIGITTQTPIYINDAKFSCKFIYEKKHAINSYVSNLSEDYPKQLVTQELDSSYKPAVSFWLKNYEVNQSFGFVGSEAVLSVDNFYASEDDTGTDFHLKSAEILLCILNVDNDVQQLYKYNLPFMVKSKTQSLMAENLIKTTLEFSFNGAQYAANDAYEGLSFKPPVSPYNGYNVLIASDFV